MSSFSFDTKLCTFSSHLVLRPGTGTASFMTLFAFCPGVMVSEISDCLGSFLMAKTFLNRSQTSSSSSRWVSSISTTCSSSIATSAVPRLPPTDESSAPCRDVENKSLLLQISRNVTCWQPPQHPPAPQEWNFQDPLLLLQDFQDLQEEKFQLFPQAPPDFH